MNTMGYAWVARIALLSILAVGLAPEGQAGVPEPAITLYGKVVNESDDLITSGEMNLSYTPPLGGEAIHFSVDLSAVIAEGGPFSYRLEIPCERPLGGMDPTPNTLQISSSAIEYTRTATVENLNAVLLDAVTISLSDADRGAIERLDMQVAGIVVSPPPVPTGPSPAQGQSSVPLTTSLSWNSHPSVTSYDLYFWEASQSLPATPVAAGLLSSQYIFPAPLAYDTSYNWQVVAHNAVDATAGDVWSFSTVEEMSAEGEGSQEFLWGDIGGTGTSGEVSCNDAPGGQDASLILQWYAGMVTTLYGCPDGTPYTAPAYPPGADVTGDGMLGGQDASEILRYFAGIIDCFPADGNCNNVGPAKSRKSTSAARLVSIPKGMALPSAGSDLLVPVALDDAKAVQSYRVVVHYPADQLSLTAVLPGEVSANWAAPTVNPLPGGVVIVNAGFTPLSGAGELLNLVFQVRDFARGGRLILGAQTELNDQHIPILKEDGDFGRISNLKITKHPAGGLVASGQKVELKVATEDATGPLHYQWKHDGKMIGADTPTYTIDSTSESDSGRYICQVSDELDTINSNEAELRVAKALPISTAAMALLAFALLGLSFLALLRRRRRDAA